MPVELGAVVALLLHAHSSGLFLCAVCEKVRTCIHMVRVCVCVCDMFYII